MSTSTIQCFSMHQIWKRLCEEDALMPEIVEMVSPLVKGMSREQRDLAIKSLNEQMVKYLSFKAKAVADSRAHEKTENEFQKKISELLQQFGWRRQRPVWSNEWWAQDSSCWIAPWIAEDRTGKFKLLCFMILPMFF
jgi:hypothetical protein